VIQTPLVFRDLNQPRDFVPQTHHAGQQVHQRADGRLCILCEDVEHSDQCGLLCATLVQIEERQPNRSNALAGTVHIVVNYACRRATMVQ
jgi:hypothetical protein